MMQKRSYYSRIAAVYFSPVGTTAEAVRLIADTLSAKLGIPDEYLDFTLPEEQRKQYSFREDDIVVFGVPTYAGRVPNKILPVIQSGFCGNGAAAVPVVTFGNRSFDDSLKELSLVLTDRGFRIVSGAALATEHVFSEKIGTGRPDRRDREEIVGFAEDTAELLRMTACGQTAYSELQIPGRDPVGPYYTPLGTDGKPARFLKAKPVTDPEKCDHCGICAAVCPMGSISREDETQVEGICIKCQACIKKCPRHARCFTDEAFLSHVAMLEQNYTKRAGNVFCIRQIIPCAKQE